MLLDEREARGHRKAPSPAAARHQFRCSRAKRAWQPGGSSQASWPRGQPRRSCLRREAVSLEPGEHADPPARVVAQRHQRPILYRMRVNAISMAPDPTAECRQAIVPTSLPSSPTAGLAALITGAPPACGRRPRRTSAIRRCRLPPGPRSPTSRRIPAPGRHRDTGRRSPGR
jgi:hypothetical protein